MGGWTPCLGSEALVQGPVLGGRLPIGSRSRSGPLGGAAGGAFKGEKLAYGASPGHLAPMGPATLPPCLIALCGCLSVRSSPLPICLVTCSAGSAPGP